MGFFNFLGKVASDVQRQAEQKQREIDRHARNVTGSAIPSGRMRQTDAIKGKDSTIPTEAGIYRHSNKQTGEVEYVGQTNNLRKRQQEHARNGKYNPETQNVQYSTARKDASKDNLLQTEKDHISRHKPKGNTTAGGNGRR
jgi:hypothetical protein